MQLHRFSIGIGDRFGHQGVYQLKALQAAMNDGVSITPVWNKSNREHIIVKSSPADTLKAAENAVLRTGWKNDFHLDADHINLSNVEEFISYCDFFTIDVADYIDKPCVKKVNEIFLNINRKLVGKHTISGIEIVITTEKISHAASRFGMAVAEAAEIFNYILTNKGIRFITEISLDETIRPQSPEELLIFLHTISDYNIPVQTIAPKFSGSFLKGIDYIGSIEEFAEEFEKDILVLEYCKEKFGMADNLKLSIHSGSDKFSLYPIINKIIYKYNAGIHLKTAGTTWLEEITGLAESGSNGLEIAKEIYCKAIDRYDELVQPYSAVTDIDKNKLPSVTDVKHWNSKEFVETLQNNQNNENYNPSFRQFIHISYKIAAELSNDYINALKENAEIIGKNVKHNILERHIKPLFYEYT